MKRAAKKTTTTTPKKAAKRVAKKTTEATTGGDLAFADAMNAGTATRPVPDEANQATVTMNTSLAKGRGTKEPGTPFVTREELDAVVATLRRHGIHHGQE